METQATVEAWPERNPDWKRLVDTAANVLNAADASDGFTPVLPAQGEPVAAPVAQHRAREAVLELLDLAPEWTREAPIETWSKRVLDELIAPQPIADALAPCHPEFAAPDEVFTAAKAAMPGESAPTIPDKAIPCAVAAVAAARARAGLLAAASDPARPVHADALPVTDLLYQCHVVLETEKRSAAAIHPSVVYELGRAALLCSYAVENDASDLLDGVRELQTVAATATERLLAQDIVVGSRPVHAIALAYCGATLALPSPREASLIAAALEAAARGQQPNGAWSEGRQLTGHSDPDTGKPFVLSTYDVALAVAEALDWQSLSAVAESVAPSTLVSALRRATDNAVQMVVHAAEGADEPIDGWVTDGTYGRTIIETNPTASVLRLAITLRRVSEIESAAAALKRFDLVWDPRRGDPVAPYLEWDDYIKKNEPDEANPILPSLHDWIVEPIRKHRRTDRRPWATARGKSFLLFGPPGTTKTTIVKAMAQGLQWPLVTLSPGDFIRDGLEHVERRAITVFKLLEQLAGVVVLFDECDELFRSRAHTARNENDQIRSISAFMTASMLPKLQDLRDRERIVFVIATNYFGQIDSAVKRIGRIDHIVGVSWPDTAQRQHMIASKLRDEAAFQELSQTMRTYAIEQLAAHTRYCIRGDVVQLASKLGRRATELRLRKKIDAVVSELTHKAPKVEPQDLDAFRSDAEERSETHQKDRGELVA